MEDRSRSSRSHSVTVTMLILCTLGTVSKGHQVRPACPPDVKVCEFYLELKEALTMTAIREEGEDNLALDFDEDGNTYRLLGRSRERVEDVDLSNIPLGDGSFKEVLVFNHSLPGPPIIVYEGQQVVVKVWNKLTEFGTTLHFHGLKQLNTPWMDGVAGVSQCDILPNQQFTYRFLASPVGTHWYHSHYGSQRSVGAAGPLIVLERDEEAAQQRREDAPLPKFDDDVYMLIQDWFREDIRDIFQLIGFDAVSFGNGYDKESCFKSTKQPDGIDSGVVPFVSALINGRGRYMGQDARYPQPTFVPFEVFKIRKGGFLRFRVIGASMMFPFRVSVDNHQLYLIASDGNPLRPQKADTFIIFNGERYDFYIEGTDSMNVGNYWIRIETLEKRYQNKLKESDGVKAILRYDGAAVTDPTTSPNECTEQEHCHEYNCPYTPEVSRTENVTCHSLTDLTHAEHSPTLQPEEGEEIEEYFLNFHFAFPDVDNVTLADLRLRSPVIDPQTGKPAQFRLRDGGGTEKPTVNGVQHKLSVSSPMTFPDNPDKFLKRCHYTSCEEGLCRECDHRIYLPLNKIIQFNLIVTVNNAPGVINGNDHPVHIHGHSVQVLKVGFPKYHPETKFYANTSSDFTCVDEGCNNIAWTNSSWLGGNVPGLLEEGAPYKDSLVIPVGGYTVVRFKTDNPGYWYMHCHIEFHNAEGMGLVLRAGEESQMNAKPEHMRTCSDFRFSDDQTNDEAEVAPCVIPNRRYFITILVLGGLSLFLTSHLIVFLCQRQMDGAHGVQKVPVIEPSL